VENERAAAGSAPSGAILGRKACDLDAIEADMPYLRPEVADEEPRQSGFTRGGGADDAKRATRLDGKTDGSQEWTVLPRIAVGHVLGSEAP